MILLLRGMFREGALLSYLQIFVVDCKKSNKNQVYERQEVLLRFCFVTEISILYCIAISF